MTDQSEGRRTQRSRDALRGALFAAIRDRSYDAVSVAEICDAANVGRSTFYEHYRSKEDILRAAMRPLFEIFAENLLAPEPSAAFMRVVEHLWDNRKLADEVFSGPAGRVLTKQHVELIVAKLAENPRTESARDSAIVAMMIAKLQIGMLHAWLTGALRVSAQTLVTSLLSGANALALSTATPP